MFADRYKDQTELKWINEGDYQDLGVAICLSGSWLDQVKTANYDLKYPESLQLVGVVGKEVFTLKWVPYRVKSKECIKKQLADLPELTI